LRRQPFEPFEVHLTNGEKHIVRHPEQVALGQARVVIVYPETDGIVLCSLLHVAAIEILQAA
jgi:hypothetical protein